MKHILTSCPKSSHAKAILLEKLIVHWMTPLPLLGTTMVVDFF